MSKKSKRKKGIIIVSSLIIVLIGFFVGLFIYGLTPVSDKSEKVNFTIKSGESKITVVKKLKDAGLSKSELALFVYVFFHSDMNLQAGTYELDRNMSAKEILYIISTGKIIDEREVFKVTFVEGKRLKAYVKLISEKFNFSEEDIYNVINNEEFLKKLIDKYWFIDETILKSELIYPLEGYLFPSTYEFYSDATIESIIYRMLDEMGKKLESYKNIMTEKNMNTHEVLSMASIIEKEALTAEDRKTVSQVIYKRLELKMSLGMDVTTYYAVQKELTDGLSYNDLSSDSPYNTRNNNLIGLPVGPICSPSLESIDAVFNPSETNYIYFYADLATGKVYFSETYQDFLKYKQELGG